MVRTASSVYALIGWEATFGGGASNTQLFGKDQEISSLEFSNNQRALPQLYTPEIKNFLYGRNSGGCGVKYVLSNPFQFTNIFNVPVSEILASGITTRTWSSDPAVNSNARLLKSSHLEIGGALTGANVVRNAKGVITQSINFKTSIDNPVDVNQQLIWGIEDAVGTTLNASVPTDSGFTPYNFVEATVEMPDNTVLATVQDLDLTFNINSELLYGLGSANAVKAYRKLFEMTGKVTLAFEDATHFNQVKARTELADMEIIFTNGLSSTDLRSITITFTGVGLSKHGVPSIIPGEPVFQEFDFQCRSVQVVSKDATAAFTWT